MNPEKIEEIEAAGLEFVGRDESGLRMEIAEIPREQNADTVPQNKKRRPSWRLISRAEGYLEMFKNRPGIYPFCHFLFFF